MVNQPRVSVIIPTYNRPDYLRKALSDVLSQTYGNYEIIVSDNSNKKENELVVGETRDQRVTYRANEINVGLFQNLNSAILKSRGDIIFFLEDDCRIPDRDFLKKMVEVYDRYENCPLAVCRRYQIIDSSDEVKHVRSLPILPDLKLPFDDPAIFKKNANGVSFIEREKMFQLLCKRNAIYSPMISYSRKTLQRIGLYDASVLMAADWLHYLKISRYYDFPFFESLVHYRIHEKSETSDITKRKNKSIMILDLALIYFKFQDFCDKNGFPNDAKKINAGIAEYLLFMIMQTVRQRFSFSELYLGFAMLIFFNPFRAVYNNLRDRKW